MKIVIAGGTGTIGKALAHYLASRGHELVILSRNPQNQAEMASDYISLKKWQVDSIDGWGAEIDGADIVVNFAGENLAGDKFLPDRWTQAKKQRISGSRIAAGLALNEAIAKAKHKPSVLVQSSAIGYYGPRADEIVNELSQPGQDILANICVEWESTTAPVEELGVRRIIARTGLVLNTESGPLPRLLVRFNLLVGGPFGSGKQWWSWIHLDDVIRAIHFLIENESAAGPFNLTSPNPLTNSEFSNVLGQVMSRPSFVPLPGFALKLLVGEVATVVLDGQRVLPHNLDQLGYVFSYPNLEGTLHNLLD